MDAAALVAWFRANARDLPWRLEPREPYRVWVSEAMLQQTRVETVLRYYEPFLARFPDVRALAEADEEELMRAWEGMGYYRRARALQQAAREVVARHGGELPREAAALRELPGFGPYTAGAVASLAFGAPEPAVDGNVLRVFARQTGTRAPTREAAEAWARDRYGAIPAAMVNEALMELGATVCTPRAPRCGGCPVAASCAAPGDALPARATRRRVPVVRVSLAFAERDGRLLLERRDEGLLAGTWGLPWVEGPPRLLARHVEALVGGPVVVERVAATRGRHAFTHRVWDMRVHRVRTDARDGTWRKADEVALGTAHRRVLAALNTPTGGAPSDRPTARTRPGRRTSS